MMYADDFRRSAREALSGNWALAVMMYQGRTLV